MAKSRIGHIVEAEILQAIGVDYIDECVCRNHRTRMDVLTGPLTQV